MFSIVLNEVPLAVEHTRIGIVEVARSCIDVDKVNMKTRNSSIHHLVYLSPFVRLRYLACIRKWDETAIPSVFNADGIFFVQSFRSDRFLFCVHLLQFMVRADFFFQQIEVFPIYLSCLRAANGFLYEAFSSNEKIPLGCWHNLLRCFYVACKGYVPKTLHTW